MTRPTGGATNTCLPRANIAVPRRPMSPTLILIDDPFSAASTPSNAYCDLHHLHGPTRMWRGFAQDGMHRPRVWSAETRPHSHNRRRLPLPALTTDFTITTSYCWNTRGYPSERVLLCVSPVTLPIAPKTPWSKPIDHTGLAPLLMSDASF